MIAKSILKVSIAAALLFAAPVSVDAQVEFPAPSPITKVEQRVGLTDISLEYSRPGVKDRDIFGTLVPYGEIWRLGANASTKISFSEDVTVAGNEVPAGEYALYMIPNEEEWTVIIHKNTSHWGVGDYKQEEDLCRFNVKVVTMADEMSMESMLLYINEIRDNSCTLEFVWANKWLSIPIDLGTKDAVVKKLEAAMAGPDGRMHYQAARFYMDNDNMDKALQHIQIAVNEKDYSRFWSERVHALVLAEMGKYKEAIEVATKSKTMAEEAGNADYVRMNEKSIEEWTAKL